MPCQREKGIFKQKNEWYIKNMSTKKREIGTISKCDLDCWGIHLGVVYHTLSQCYNICAILFWNPLNDIYIKDTTMTDNEPNIQVSSETFFPVKFNLDL